MNNNNSNFGALNGYNNISMSNNNNNLSAGLNDLNKNIDVSFIQAHIEDNPGAD